MRVSSITVLDSLRRYMGESLERIAARTAELSSGKRILKPSDDVTAAVRAAEVKLSMANTDQYQRNIDEALSHLGFTDTVLSSVTETLQRAKDLALTGVNGSQSAESRRSLALEVGSLKRELLRLANSKLRGVYVFAGFKRDTMPFDPATYAYRGDAGLINVVTDSNESLVPLNVPGDQAFSYSLSSDETVTVDDTHYVTYRDVGGAIEVEVYDNNSTPADDSDDTLVRSFTFSNFIDMLGQLEEALEGNDVLKARALLRPIDRALDTVGDVRADVGARIGELDTRRTRLADHGADMATMLSSLEDADYVEVVTELTQAQQTLEALRQLASRILPTSLFDFLR